MFFRVHWRKTELLGDWNEVVLFQDLWDDFGFKTLFTIKYFDPFGAARDLGYVQIGYQGMTDGKVIEKLPTEFDELGKRLFFAWFV